MAREICYRCEGCGWINGTLPRDTRCPQCKGKGWVEVRARLEIGDDQPRTEGARSVSE